MLRPCHPRAAGPFELLGPPHLRRIELAREEQPVRVDPIRRDLLRLVGAAGEEPRCLLGLCKLLIAAGRETSLSVGHLSSIVLRYSRHQCSMLEKNRVLFNENGCIAQDKRGQSDDETWPKSTRRSLLLQQSKAGKPKISHCHLSTCELPSPN